MIRLCLRRRRSFIIGILLTVVVVFSVFLPSSLRASYSVDIPSDYDFIYNSNDEGYGVQNIFRSAGNIDRRPQAHQSEDADLENGDYPTVKKYAFLHQGKHKWKTESDNEDEDDDEYESNAGHKGHQGDTDDDLEGYDDYWDENPVFNEKDFDPVSKQNKSWIAQQASDVEDKVHYKFQFQEQVTASSSKSTQLQSERSQLQSDNKGRSNQYHSTVINSSLDLHGRTSQKPKHIGGLVEGNDIEPPATQLEMPEVILQHGTVFSREGYSVVTNYIYWSKEVEDFVPKGISSSTVQNFVHKARSLPVKEMHSPQWNRCGRPKNQYIVLADGTSLCARYRDPHNKLILGEVLSFHLAQMLGLDNVPVVTLTQVNSSAPQWLGQNISSAAWEEGKVLAFIQWVEKLETDRSRVKMPPVILAAYEKGAVLNNRHPALSTMTQRELAELLQWSDMIVLDYITGHYDRIASMQDGADQENKPSIMTESIRNLRKESSSGKLWLIDNESGLFDAYELLYHSKDQRFINFHLRMLHTICLFRESLIENINNLITGYNHPENHLVSYTRTREPLFDKLPKTSEYILFKTHFSSRLKEVQKWVQECQSR